MTGRREIACPYCGRINDQHAHTVGVGTPGDGDVGLCWGCGEPAIFVDGPYGLTQRRATDDERAEILADPEVRRAVAAIALAQRPQDALRGLRGDLS